jgi:hypothetical protein
VLDNHSVKLRTQDKEIVLQVAWREWESFFDCSPRVQYKPRVSSSGKFTLAITLCTWSPNEVAHCLVLSASGGRGSDIGATSRRGQPLSRRTERGRLSLFAGTHFTPKFGSRLNRHGQASENASGRWARFFQCSVKNGQNRTATVRLHQVTRDAHIHQLTQLLLLLLVVAPRSLALWLGIQWA